jgi:hypothetical protein
MFHCPGNMHFAAGSIHWKKATNSSTTKADESVDTVLPEQCVQEDQQEIATILIPTHVLAEKSFVIICFEMLWAYNGGTGNLKWEK